MNNEPVAWMLLGLEDRKPKLINLQVIEHLEGTWFPLYTHPSKDLTDEEIYTCFHQYFVLGEPKPTHYELEYEDLIDFARAILRKAQEK